MTSPVRIPGPGRGPRGVLLDLAGVVYQDDRLLPGAREAVETLRGAGVRVRFVTNTSRRCRQELVRDVGALGLEIAPGEVFTAPLAARARIESLGVAPHLLVHPGLLPDFEGLPEGPPGAVVVGDAADGFTYDALNTAFRCLIDGAALFAVGRNRYFREAGALSLDAGPFVAALEYAAGVEASITGKPARAFFEAAVADLGIESGAVLMVGDDVEADVLGAREAGLGAVLVRTGKYREDDEDRLEGSGAWVADDLSAVVETILSQ